MRPNSNGGAGALYRAFQDTVRVPLGAGELLYAPLTRSAFVASPDAVRALFHCQGFATLDEHAARAATTKRPARAVRADLEALAASGILVARDDLARHLEVGDDPSPPGKIALLGILTRDRPESVAEALASYADNAERHGRELEIVVLDQSTAANGERVQAAVISARRRGVAVQRVDDATVASFAARLAARAGVSPDIVAFALANPEGCASTGGAGRNALLLHGAGRAMAMADDDTRAELAPWPHPEAGVALTSEHLPWEHAFPASGAAARAIAADVDALALHEELLGRRPGDVVEGAVVDASRASSMFFRRLAPDGGRIATTFLGSAGDSGTGSMLHLLTLVGASRARVLASEAVYREAFHSRQVVRAASRPTITDGAGAMTMMVGLDARELLPPFFPVQRNGDGVFGVALRITRHGLYAGFLPWTVVHTPPTSRRAEGEEAWRGAFSYDLGDIVLNLVLSSRVEADRRDPARSVRSLGEVLERWGSLPIADFEEIARLHLMRARGRDIELFAELASTDGAPGFWARDVARALAGLRASVADPSLVVPADLRATIGDVAARAKLPVLVRRFGELLRAWPALVEAARDLRARDQGLLPPGDRG